MIRLYVDLIISAFTFQIMNSRQEALFKTKWCEIIVTFSYSGNAM